MKDARKTTQVQLRGSAAIGAASANKTAAMMLPVMYLWSFDMTLMRLWVLRASALSSPVATPGS